MDEGRGRGHPRTERSRLLCLRRESSGRRTDERCRYACRLNAAMRERLARRRGPCRPIYGELDCPQTMRLECDDAAKRKPDAGLLLTAMNEWPIVGEQSFFIGVSRDDVEAAKSAGISGHVFEGATSARLVHSLLAQFPHARRARRTGQL